ncbi:hypothetical protein [Bacillus atrophaeus]|uniref:hypothetical protein n=1 Tax=Bacillus atrophaeus TaxID=1452 RepID=UPI00288018C7|nr:hypothetical protein [Bacillus atrophaeus]MDS9995360.1 hypothetical protein [Bacillus atrophaeus]
MININQGKLIKKKQKYLNKLATVNDMLREYDENEKLFKLQLRTFKLNRNNQTKELWAVEKDRCPVNGDVTKYFLHRYDVVKRKMALVFFRSYEEVHEAISTLELKVRMK